MKRYYAYNLVCNPEHFIGAGLCHRQKEGWQLAGAHIREVRELI